MPIHYEEYEEDRSDGGFVGIALGTLAGFAAGVLLAQKFGGIEGIANRMRQRFGEGMQARFAGGAAQAVTELSEEDELDEEFDDGEDDVSAEGAELEERVLEAFVNDPILGERAIDIGAVGEGVIELTGWVYTEEEADHAVVLTRGVPGVDTVVNRLSVREEEEELDGSARRGGGETESNGGHWEGQQVGIGKRRQGTSDEFDRHADPKPDLEERWLRTDQALEAAADDTDGIAERRQRTKKPVKGDRTGGSPVAPTGVPKADHVANPTSTETREVLREQTGRDVPNTP